MKSVKLVVLLLVAALAVTVLSSPVAAYRMLQPSAGPALDEVTGAGELEAPEEEGAESMSIAAAPEIWVKPMTSTVVLDSVFTVEVMKTSEEALGAFDFHLMWDPSRIEFLGVARGADVAETATFTDSRKAPAIRYVACLALDPEQAVPEGTGALAEFEFRAIDTGPSPLDIIDSTEAEDYPEELKIEGVTLADTDENPLSGLVVMDGEVMVASEMNVFLPLVLKNH